MLTSLRRRDVPKADEVNAIDLLIECHGRIRHFTSVAKRLAEAKDVAEEEIREAATRLIRYFTISLPLHSEDEEASLLPRLIAVAPSEVGDALETMRAEHGPIHALLDELVVDWKKLAEAPGRLETLAGGLKRRADALGLAFDEHLVPEEALIFPAARQWLRPEAIAEIHKEMRARREGRAF